jgi:N-acetylmuramoyl-L-alanine amidase
MQKRREPHLHHGDTEAQRFYREHQDFCLEFFSSLILCVLRVFAVRLVLSALLLFSFSPLLPTAETVCIDPGHSKATVGAVGRRGGVEYKLCWEIAVKLKAELEKSGVDVVLTKRNAAENVTNEARAGVANTHHAALFLRLHCDAGSESGLATFYPASPGRKDGVRGPSKEIIAASRRAASVFHPATIKALGGALKSRGIRTDKQTAIGRKQGALTGSIHSKVPVLLIEMGVISNSKDEAFLIKPANQNTLARALAKGVQAVLDSHPNL